MKVIRFARDKTPIYGILEGDDIFQMNGSFTEEFHKGEKIYEIGDVRLLPPIRPRTILGAGSNYFGLLKKLNLEIPKEPQLFLKASSCVIGHEEDIIIPEGTNDLRLESELAVVIKREARYVSETNAPDYILGLTCANDLTIPDINDRFPTRNKCFYTSCPLGPCIATGVNGKDLNIKARLNGELIVNDSTGGMVFGINKLISYITSFMPLEPLDVILTGTPGGGGKLKEGDIIEIEIEEIGTLRNKVSKGRATH